MSGFAVPQRLSKPKARYFFARGEDLGEAVGRILSEQLRQAIEILSRPGNSLEEAVHEARRCLKRSRSLLRLVRFAIPRSYKHEDRRLRNVGRSLSELRDSHALIETLQHLNERQNGGDRHPSVSAAFEGVGRYLARRGDEIATTMKNGGMDQLLKALNKSRKALEELNFAEVDGKGVSKSLFRSVKRGMEAFAEAERHGEAEKFHDWRKRAKDLRYQLSLLSELRPDLQSYAHAAKKLEQLLGDDHNLAVLMSLMGKAQLADAEGIRALQKDILRQQGQLRDQAQCIGQQIYGEKRKTWKHRLAPASPASWP
jgi:CHAD domain-containing protein